MNKNRKMVIVLLFAFVVCFSLAGCTLQDRIEEYSSDKEQCYLNTENVTRFSYKGNDYTILADTVSNGGLGEWIGYIRQLAAIARTEKYCCKKMLKRDFSILSGFGGESTKSRLHYSFSQCICGS